MGDHARREMIVRIEKSVRQNPAYRPIADNLTTSDEIFAGGCLFSPMTSQWGNVAILPKRARLTFLISLLIGCSSARTPSPGLPIPTPPISVQPASTSWTFDYAPGPMQYQVSRSAAIEGQSNSDTSREISTNTTHELITLVPAGESGISFSAVVDAFSSTTQGLIGPAQSVQLPVELSGIFAGDSLTIKTNSSNDRCNPVGSALLSDLHNLLTEFPAGLTQGFTWRDSVSTPGCQAGIPTISRLLRSYVVSGEAIYEGRPVLLVQRSDTVQAHGDGAQQQHAVKLDAAGTGSAIYYLNTKDGRVVRLTANHELTLTITASNKPHRFRQSSAQDFRLVH